MDKLGRVLHRFFSISIIQFIWFNFFCRSVLRKKGCYLIPYRHSVIQIHRNAKIILNNNLYVNANLFKGSHSEAYLILHENSRMTITGAVCLNTGVTIQVFQRAILEMGEAYINCGATIMCGNKITIGNDILIARDVFIYDSDFHDILNECGIKTNIDKEIKIGNHIWIGVKSMIMRGVKIEDGAVIAANSTVLGKVKKDMLVSGSPARAFMKVKWRK